MSDLGRSGAFVQYPSAAPVCRVGRPAFVRLLSDLEVGFSPPDPLPRNGPDCSKGIRQNVTPFGTDQDWNDAPQDDRKAEASRAQPQADVAQTAPPESSSSAKSAKPAPVIVTHAPPRPASLPSSHSPSLQPVVRQSTPEHPRGRVSDLPQEVAVRKPLGFRERRWVPLALFAGDVAALELALLLGTSTHAALRPVLAPLLEPFGVGLGGLRAGEYASLAMLMAVMPLIFFAVGLVPGYGMSVVERLRKRVYTVGLIFVALIVGQYLLVQERPWRGVSVRQTPSRGVLLMTFGFAVVLIPLVGVLVRGLLIRFRCWGRPVVIIGAGGTGRLLIRLLRREPELGLVPVAVYDDDPQKWRDDAEGVPVLGPVANSKQIALRRPNHRPIRQALIAMPSINTQRLTHLTNRLPFRRIVVVPDLIGVASLWVRPRDLGGLVGLEVRRNLMLRRNWVVKRAVDYALGIPLLLLSLPVMGVFALWIKGVSPGPAFFRQERVGFGGKMIRVWKLRTMYPDAEARLSRTLEEDEALREEWAQCFKLKNDPRVLPGVGRLLRRTSLDELPQLFNIIAGQMSLVGPRPFPRYHLESYPPRFRTVRRSVLPGLTGLWQVNERSDADPLMQELLDTYYVRNWSLWLDLHVLLRTVTAVIVGRGAY